MGGQPTIDDGTRDIKMSVEEPPKTGENKVALIADEQGTEGEIDELAKSLSLGGPSVCGNLFGTINVVETILFGDALRQHSVNFQHSV